MGLLSDVMKGYSDAMLGPDQNALAEQLSKSYAGVNQAVQDQNAQAAQAWGADPANAGKEFTAPTGLDAWKQKIDAMMASNNPQLQKIALKQYDDITRSRAAGPKAADLPTAVREYQYAQGQGFGGSFQDWKNANRAKGTSVNVSVGGQAEKPIPINELTKMVLPDGSPVPIGSTYSQAQGLGAKLKASGSDTATGATTDLMEEAVSNLEGAENTPGVTGLPGYLLEQRTSGVAAPLVNAAANYMGNKISPQQAKIVQASQQVQSQMIKALSGASASDAEASRIKAQLPMPGQDPATFKANMAATKRNLAMLRARQSQAGIATTTAATRKPQSQSKPAATQNYTSKSGIAFTVE